ncbi:hypothetical protein NDU88_006335 [Pleurodeles waltl]|uniref:Uncharacterized protein n=1 Tax=Pleurodeles waltl TaxID=8319 RepID=A0AAV7QJS1_PLEWA|nr:hypothetical protein NDU88_006335 [Pleurodeles waltl]
MLTTLHDTFLHPLCLRVCAMIVYRAPASGMLESGTAIGSRGASFCSLRGAPPEKESRACPLHGCGGGPGAKSWDTRGSEGWIVIGRRGSGRGSARVSGWGSGGSASSPRLGPDRDESRSPQSPERLPHRWKVYQQLWELLETF